MSIVEKYWQGVAQRLQIEADVFNQLIAHNGETGRENETSLSQLVQNLLPPTVGVGTGIVIDSQGRRSRQCDLIVFDRAGSPSVMAQTNQLLYPVETVLLAIEVKTAVTLNEVKDVSAKVDALNLLENSQASGQTPLVLFGYRCGDAPASIIKAIASLESETAPISTCIMRPGVFGTADRVGLVPLHKIDEQGKPLSGEWEKPENEGDTEVIIGASNYPVTRIARYSHDKVIRNPGRTLLLFCAELLSLLQQMNSVSAAWFENYIDETARELIQYEP